MVQFWVDKVIVKVQFITTDHTPIDPLTTVKGTITNQHSGTCQRCSGPALRRHLYTATSPGISGAGNLYDPGGADLVTAQQHLAGSVDFQAYLQNVHNNGGVALQGQQQGVHLGVFELPREAQRNVEDFSLSLGQAGSAPAVLPKTDGIHRKA
ncbi:hypothetical protein DTO217A2_6955 [Paecilomyces variotii]|nr:hypothetical protein DTO217A2_6955 [Paecilomyces variotii]